MYTLWTNSQKTRTPVSQNKFADNLWMAKSTVKTNLKPFIDVFAAYPPEALKQKKSNAHMSHENELVLYAWVCRKDISGDGADATQLQLKAAEIIQKAYGRKAKNGRRVKFEDCLPGPRWMAGFMRRWQDYQGGNKHFKVNYVRARSKKNIENCQAATLFYWFKCFNTWFQEKSKGVKAYLKDYRVNPQLAGKMFGEILQADEIQVNGKPGKKRVKVLSLGGLTQRELQSGYREKIQELKKAVSTWSEHVTMVPLISSRGDLLSILLVFQKSESSRKKKKKKQKRQRQNIQTTEITEI